MFRSKLLVILAAGLAWCSLAGADSIWERRDPRAAALFQDNKARGVGDLLTVTISETTTTNEREQRALDKNMKNNADANYQGNYTFGAKSAAAGNLKATGSTNTRRQFSGSSQLTSDRRFVDRMAVTVVDVLPNGNLVFEGSRTRVVAGEERLLRITGVVRPTDIGAANTIQSQFIANFKVSYVGRGQESEFVNQSWLGRAVNYILP